MFAAVAIIVIILMFFATTRRNTREVASAKERVVRLLCKVCIAAIKYICMYIYYYYSGNHLSVVLSI